MPFSFGKQINRPARIAGNENALKTDEDVTLTNQHNPAALTPFCDSGPARAASVFVAGPR